MLITTIRTTFAVLTMAIKRFAAAHAAEASASIAYYFLFSLFPLLIFIVALGSLVLEAENVQREVMVWLANLFPTAADYMEHNLELVIAQRRPASIVAIIGLLWSGSGAFNLLTRNIDRAWPDAKKRNFLRTRLVALTMISVLVMLLFFSLLFSTVVSLLPVVNVWLGDGVADHSTMLAFVRTTVFPVLLTFVMFASLYRWIPNTNVTWAEAGWGAAIATIGWRLAIAGFSWYITSGLANYQLIYGSLGTVVVLMLWIYISSLITLFGAHLSAAIAHHKRLKRAT